MHLIPTTPSRPRASGGETVAAGDYVHNDRDLYRVEQISEDRALLEDSRDGELYDVAVGDLEDLTRIPAPNGDDAGDGDAGAPGYSASSAFL